MRTAWNGLSQLAPQLISLASVPVLLRGLGVTGYGIWALTSTLVIFAVSLDGGISSSVQRFFALYLSQSRIRETSQLLLTLIMLVASFSGILMSLGPLVSHAVLAIVKVPAQLQSSAAYVYGHLGILIGLILINNIFTGYLRAVNRFRTLAINTTLTQGLYLVGLLLLSVHHTMNIRNVFSCTIVQMFSLVVLNAWSSRQVFETMRLKTASRREIRSFISYAWRAQIMNASSLAILQTDSLFVAALLPIEQLGYLAIAGQLASALRSAPLFAIAPLVTRITQEFGARGIRAATSLAGRINSTWVGVVSLYSAVAAAAVGFAVHGLAGLNWTASVAAAILSVGNGLNLVTGISTAYCRAIGRPGLEARYGLVLVVGNLLLSGPCTYFGGLIGAVLSTTLVQLLGLLAFIRLMRGRLPEFNLGLDGVRPFRLATAIVATLGLEMPLLWISAPSVSVLFGTAIAASTVFSIWAIWTRKRGARR